MDTTIGFPNTQLYSDFTMQLLNNWGQKWDSYFSFGFCWFQGSYAISTSSGRVDLTQLNCVIWENTKFLKEYKISPLLG